jgi:hypothetical protein
MVRAGCAATTFALASRSSILNPSRWQLHRNAPRAYHSFTLRACLRQGRRVSSTQHRSFLIGSAAIKNPRIPLKQRAVFFSNRSKSAFLRTRFALLVSLISIYFLPLAEFLIASRQILKILLTHSQQTRKLFLIASVSALLSDSCRVKRPAFHSRPSLERPVSVAVSGASRVTSHESRVTQTQSPGMAIPRGSLTVAGRSSKLLVSTGHAIRSSARAAINCEGEDRCRNALFSRMYGADIKSTGFASA